MRSVTMPNNTATDEYTLTHSLAGAPTANIAPPTSTSVHVETRHHRAIESAMRNSATNTDTSNTRNTPSCTPPTRANATLNQIPSGVDT